MAMVVKPEPPYIGLDFVIAQLSLYLAVLNPTGLNLYSYIRLGPRSGYASSFVRFTHPWYVLIFDIRNQSSKGALKISGTIMLYSQRADQNAKARILVEVNELALHWISIGSSQVTFYS